MFAQKLTNSQLNHPHRIRKKNEKSNEETTDKKSEMCRRNGLVRSVESVLRPEENLWWERFVKEVGFEMGVKQ